MWGGRHLGRFKQILFKKGVEGRTGPNTIVSAMSSPVRSPKTPKTKKLPLHGLFVHVVCSLPLVTCCGLLSPVAHYREFGFKPFRSDVGYLDVVFQHIDAHGFGKGVHGVFGGTVQFPPG